MTRAGRFLWLDRAQAQLVAHERAQDGAWERLTARHDGYRRLGLLHQRAVTAFQEGRWLVEDSLLKVGKLKAEGLERDDLTLNLQPVTCNLHWLLPDWEWEIIVNTESSTEIRLRSPWGWVMVKIQAGERAKLAGVQIVRAGQMLYGSGEAEPFLGWVSLTYGQKQPALSLTVAAAGIPPISMTTSWLLPSDQDHH
jgi:hypothetical protein